MKTKEFDFLKRKQLTKFGAVVLGTMKFGKYAKSLYIDLAKGKTDSDLIKTGFYFLVNDKIVITLNHVGVQKRQRGYKEVLTRLNNPRTDQNAELSNSLLEWVHKSNIKLMYMTYSQAHALLGLDEYNAKNNGLELIGKLRDEYAILGRVMS